MKKIALIPIDNRPICYNLIQDITDIDEDIKLYMPERKYLGGLFEPSNYNEILNWLNGLDDIDYLIISLDTIAYGGLITSRRSEDTFFDIKDRIDKLCNIIKKLNCKTYAFSSIMRISNNNINEEEKEYWNIWGKKIFEYSKNLHKSIIKNTPKPLCDIDKDIIEDYLNTRKRNFEINKLYLEMNDIFDYLIYSKDDSAKFGLNIYEADCLSSLIKDKKNNAIVKTGADEIPLSLLSRAILDNRDFKIKPNFLYKNSTNLISKYEDVSVLKCLEGQVDITGAKISYDKYHTELIINNFEFEQGDNCLGDIVNKTDNDFILPDVPYSFIDINNANGADDNFIQNILNTKYEKNFMGYTGYNTSANTIGCALCILITKYFATKYNEDAFKKLSFIRFMDDWAYQAHIRREGGDYKPFEDKINGFLNTTYKGNYIRPWNRSFEIEIIV